MSGASFPNTAIASAQATASAPRPQTAQQKKAWEQAKAFEAVFLQSLLTPVFDGLKGQGPLGGEATGNDAWKGFLVEEYAKGMAARGGIGLAPSIYRELLRHQELRHDGRGV